jgi:putative FmdB family regulatory protein
MPLYEYECDACGGRFEVIQKFSETTTECRRCGKGPVRRLIAAPAFQFKGTGWYITDYAQKGKSGSEGTSTGKESSDGTSEAAKSDGAGDGAKKSETPAAASTATATKE